MAGRKPLNYDKMVKVNPFDLLPKSNKKSIQEQAEDMFHEETEIQLRSAMERFDKVSIEPTKEIINNYLIDGEIDGKVDYVDMWNKIKIYGNKVENIRAAAGHKFNKWNAEEQVREYIAHGGQFEFDPTMKFLNHAVPIDDDKNSEPVMAQHYDIDIRSLIDDEDDEMVTIQPKANSINVTKNNNDRSTSYAIDPSLFDD